MFAAVPKCFAFLPFMSVCLFCSHIDVNTMENATGIQVRGYASFKTRMSPPKFVRKFKLEHLKANDVKQNQENVRSYDNT